MSATAEIIVESIVNDLCDRGGLDNEWGNIHEDIQREIKKAWVDIVDSVGIPKPSTHYNFNSALPSHFLQVLVEFLADGLELSRAEREWAHRSAREKLQAL